MNRLKAISLIGMSLGLISCGHKPFHLVSHDRPTSINYVLNLAGTTPSIQAIINSQKGSREFVVTPVPADATSHVFWSQFRSSFSMSLGSYDASDPSEIRLFCFPACHFTYQAAPHGAYPLKVGPTLFPKITNVRQKLIFPIYVDIHHGSPPVYTTYCHQKRHCKIMDQQRLHQQLTYWGQVFPTSTLWKGHELELLLTQHAALLPQEHLSILEAFVEKLDSHFKKHEAFRLPPQLHLLLLPPDAAQNLPTVILMRENFLLVSKTIFDTPATLLRLLLAVSLRTNASLPALDALLDATWITLATHWGTLSPQQQHQWLDIQTHYAEQNSLYSQWSLRYFLALKQKTDLRKAGQLSLDTFSPSTPFAPPSYLQTQTQTASPQQKLILWSHPEIQNIIDEPKQNPIDRGKGSLVVTITPKKKLIKK